MKKLFEAGHIVRFKNPFPHENPNDLFLVKEAHYDVDSPRGLIQEFNANTKLPCSFVILLNELEFVVFDTINLMGSKQTVFSEENSFFVEQ